MFLENNNLFLCLQEDVSLHGYKKYLLSQSSPAPLTAAEEELRQIKINEVSYNFNASKVSSVSKYHVLNEQTWE